GIFKLLVKFKLENKDNPSYTGLSFQDFYQRCREAFLVNSDLSLRTQLIEFKDHKLIRTRKVLNFRITDFTPWQNCLSLDVYPFNIILLHNRVQMERST
ncbi:Origin recognition complex subunit 2, partial [Xenoophorus captivus]